MDNEVRLTKRQRAIFKSRLIYLADELEKTEIPFDFARFVSNWDGKIESIKPKCNTTCCAFGLATTLPRFKKLGLCLIQNHDYESDGGIVAMRDDLDENFAPKVSSYTLADRAANKIFGLTSDQFDLLFIPHGQGNLRSDEQLDRFGRNALSVSATASQVAEQIRWGANEWFSLDDTRI